MSASVLCLAFLVYDVMNKVGTCGRSINYAMILFLFFLLFIGRERTDMAALRGTQTRRASERASEGGGGTACIDSLLTEQPYDTRKRKYLHVFLLLLLLLLFLFVFQAKHLRFGSF